MDANTALQYGDSATAALNGSSAGVNDAYRQYQQAVKSKQQEMQPAMQQYNKVADAPRHAIPDQKPVGAAPKQEDLQKDSQGWITALAALSSVVGSRGRARGTGALKAFAGGMKGLQQGNQQAFEDSLKTWKADSDAIIADNKMLLDKYKAVMDDRSLTEAEADQKMKMIAYEHNDDINMKAENYHQRVAMYDIKERAAEKLQEHNEKLQEKAQAIKDSTYSPEEIEYYAKELNAGDKSVLANAGRTAAAAFNVANVRKAAAELNLKNGITPEKQAMVDADYIAKTAGLKSVETRGANIAMFADEAANQFKLLRAASEALPRSELKPLSKMEVDYANNTGSIAAAKYVATIQAAVNTYTKALAGAGISTDAAKDHAYGVLDQYGSNGQIQGALDVMTQEMQTAIDAPDDIRAKIMGTAAPSKAIPSTGGEAPEGTIIHNGSVTKIKKGGQWVNQ